MASHQKRNGAFMNDWDGTGTFSAKACKLADPDIAVAHRIPMVLQHQGTCGSCTRKLRRHRGISHNWDMVLNQHPIVQHCERSWLNLTICTRFRGVKQNVVNLPLTWLAGRVHQRSVVTIERSCLAVEVGLVLIGIEHLDLVASLKSPFTSAGEAHSRCSWIAPNSWRVIKPLPCTSM